MRFRTSRGRAGARAPRPPPAPAAPESGILTWSGRKGRHNKLALGQGLRGSLKCPCNHLNFCAISNRAVQVSVRPGSSGSVLLRFIPILCLHSQIIYEYSVSPRQIYHCGPANKLAAWGRRVNHFRPSGSAFQCRLLQAGSLGPAPVHEYI